MTSARLSGSTALLSLAAVLGACSPQASAQATAAPVAFSATAAPVVSALADRGFSCGQAHEPSAQGATFGTAVDSIAGRICRKPVSGNGQGTFAYLYLLRANMSTIVGLDILSDQAGPAGVSSPEVTGVIALMFSAQDAATVEQAVVASTSEKAPKTVGTVSVVSGVNGLPDPPNPSVPQPTAQVDLEIWGPEVVAAAAAGFGPAASN